MEKYVGNIRGESSKGYKKKSQIHNDKKDKYALIKRFHYFPRLRLYIYDFMYVDPKKMAEEYYFPDTIFLLKTTRKCQLLDKSLKIGLDLVTYVQKVMQYI